MEGSLLGCFIRHRRSIPGRSPFEVLLLSMLLGLALLLLLLPSLYPLSHRDSLVRGTKNGSNTSGVEEEREPTVGKKTKRHLLRPTIKWKNIFGIQERSF